MTETNVRMTAPPDGPVTPRQRAVGVGAAMTGSASNQVGAAIGALAFPAIGSVGVVAVRQIVTALILGAVVRPRFRTMTAQQFWPVLALAVVFGGMNASLYFAVERIGLGLAVTLEFLGPLAVAIVASRRRIDLGCAVVAGVGVVILVGPGTSTDHPGIASGFLAAIGWASYILLNRRVGQQFTGLRGTSAAAVLSAVMWVPIAAVWFAHRPPDAHALMLAAVCGVLASTVPFAADMISLRRVRPGTFGTLASLAPVWAALSGWVVLGQQLTAWEFAALGLIVVGNAVVVAAPPSAPPALRIPPPTSHG